MINKKFIKHLEEQNRIFAKDPFWKNHSIEVDQLGNKVYLSIPYFVGSATIKCSCRGNFKSMCEDLIELLDLIDSPINKVKLNTQMEIL